MKTNICQLKNTLTYFILFSFLFHSLKIACSGLILEIRGKYASLLSICLLFSSWAPSSGCCYQPIYLFIWASSTQTPNDCILRNRINSNHHIHDSIQWTGNCSIVYVHCILYWKSNILDEDERPAKRKKK